MPEPFAISVAGPIPIVRYTYYAFIFSIPIETLNIGIESGMFSLAKLVGLLFIGTALLQPGVCFKKPPRAFWYFFTYILICLCLATFQSPMVMETVITRLFSLVMMVILFWVSFNLLQDKTMVKAAHLALVGACTLLAVLVLGGAGTAVDQGRASALSQNANALAATLSLGLLSLMGLAYGRNDVDQRMSLLVWMCFGVLSAGIVSTGSRGPMLGLLAGIVLLMAKRGNSALKVQVGFLAILAVSILVWASYENDAVRLRWERALMQGSFSRREEIIPVAWNMFTEKPFFGWGPVSHYLELGARFGMPGMDPHNLYLWVMTETGLLGAIPFFIGLWLCWRAAWRAIYGTEGSLPVALLACLLIVNMTGSEHNRKLFWIVLAYSLASEAALSKQRRLSLPSGFAETTPYAVGYGLQRR